MSQAFGARKRKICRHHLETNLAFPIVARQSSHCTDWATWCFICMKHDTKSMRGWAVRAVRRNEVMWFFATFRTSQNYKGSDFVPSSKNQLRAVGLYRRTVALWSVALNKKPCNKRGCAVISTSASKSVVPFSILSTKEAFHGCLISSCLFLFSQLLQVWLDSILK